jgi:hypothetical protein
MASSVGLVHFLVHTSRPGSFLLYGPAHFNMVNSEAWLTPLFRHLKKGRKKHSRNDSEEKKNRKYDLKYISSVTKGL